MSWGQLGLAGASCLQLVLQEQVAEVGGGIRKKRGREITGRERETAERERGKYMQVLQVWEINTRTYTQKRASWG